MVGCWRIPSRWRRECRAGREGGRGRQILHCQSAVRSRAEFIALAIDHEPCLTAVAPALDLEFVALTFEGEILARRRAFGAQRGPSSVALGEFNGDGRPDLAVPRLVGMPEDDRDLFRRSPLPALVRDLPQPLDARFESAAFNEPAAVSASGGSVEVASSLRASGSASETNAAG